MSAIYQRFLRIVQILLRGCLMNMVMFPLSNVITLSRPNRDRFDSRTTPTRSRWSLPEALGVLNRIGYVSCASIFRKIYVCGAAKSAILQYAFEWLFIYGPRYPLEWMRCVILVCEKICMGICWFNKFRCACFVEMILFYLCVLFYQIFFSLEMSFWIRLWNII